jgi:hypothetical protein
MVATRTLRPVRRHTDLLIHAKTESTLIWHELLQLDAPIANPMIEIQKYADYTAERKRLKDSKKRKAEKQDPKKPKKKYARTRTHARPHHHLSRKKASEEVVSSSSSETEEQDPGTEPDV